MPLVPYAGNPANFPEFVSELDDSVPRTAGNLNPATEGNADRTAWLRAQTGGFSPQNWLPPTSVGSLAWYAAIWNAITDQWVAAVTNTSTFDTVLTQGSGIDAPGTGTWTSLGSGPVTLSATKTVRSIAVDPDGIHYYLATLDSGGSPLVQLYVVTAAGAYLSIQFVVTAHTDIQLVSFGGYLTAVVGATVPFLLVAAEPVPAATPMTAIPVSTISGAPGGAVASWIAKSNGSYILLVPTDVQATPYMLKSTPSANLTLVGSWTAETALSSVVNATDNITGLDWNGTAWLATVHRGSTTRFIRSIDGINWTLVSTLTGTIAGGNFLAMAFAARAWVALIAAGAAIDIGFSLDGGVTWYLTQAVLLSPGALAPGIAGAPTQAAAWDTSTLRFSACASLPAAPLT